METPKVNGRIDLDLPRWDQSTFLGRLKHFASISDYRLVPVSKRKLDEAKELLEQYRQGSEPPGTKDEQVWYAKKLYGSAFHPDSGDLQNVIGRMSFQVPGGMILTAAMLQFYRTNAGVIITQWLNQSFNALVNYTNRNAGSTLTTKQMTVAYTTATTCALVTALGMKSVLSTRGSPLLQRYVPFMAVASANFVNIPLTRQDEIINGVTLLDDNNNEVTSSKYAAVKGITQVVLSRVVMAAPGMMVMPIIMDKMERRAWFRANTWCHLPFQTFMVGCFLTFMVPLGCALFPQRSSISVDRLRQVEPEKYQDVLTRYGSSGDCPKTLYFNKGL